MNIGIIVHSFSGNTLSVAEKLAEKLKSMGHEVHIERIQVKGGEQQNLAGFTLENPPEAARYGALVFGAPVRGFSLSPVMSAYLKGISPVTGKKVACFATKHFANNWTGGKSAIETMRKSCAEKGGNVVGTGVVFWKSSKKDAMTKELIESFSGLF